MTLDRFESMRTFVEIVDAGSFSAAAFRLGVSVPAVSRRLGGFEERIGASLLHRTTRSLALTEIGQTYYQRAKDILAHLEEVEKIDRRNFAVGMIRLMVPQFFGRLVVAPRLPELLARHPGLRVELVVSEQRTGTEVVPVDARVELTSGDAPRVRGERLLGSYRRVVCAAPSYLQRAGVPAVPDDLALHNCIRVGGAAGGGDEWHLKADGRGLSVSVEGRFYSNDIDAALSATLAGAGMAYLPIICVEEHLRYRRLQVVLEKYESEPVEARLVAVARTQLISLIADYLTRGMSGGRDSSRLSA